jgi:TPP-dependent pyruvate/acetoin dehydrogenase alpha subunit
VMRQVKAGIQFAEQSPFPDADSLLDDVYATGS